MKLLNIIIPISLLLIIFACDSIYSDLIENPENKKKEIIYIFATSSATDGDIGGRIGADAFCQATLDSTYPEVGNSNVRALINVSATDQLSDMPQNYGVSTSNKIQSFNKVTIANNWNHLLSSDTTNLLVTLYNAGVTPADNEQYWTGSQPTGEIDFYYCNGWRYNGPGDIFDDSTQGMTGVSSVVDGFWAQAILLGCDMKRKILCLSY